MKVLDISKNLFDAWNKAELKYCVWKGCNHVWRGMAGQGDIDILVDIDQKSLCHNILSQNGFLCCNSQYGVNINNVYDWLGLDYKTGQQIHVHLYFQIVVGKQCIKEYLLPWTTQALVSRVWDKNKNIYIQSPELELISRYTIIGIEKIDMRVDGDNKSVLPDKLSKEIGDIKKCVDWQSVFKNLIYYFHQDASIIFSIMKSDTLKYMDYKKLSCIVEKHLKKHIRYNRYAIVKQHYLSTFKIVLNRTRNRFFDTDYIIRKTPKQGGVVITFLGQDGAGKSTVSKDIQNWLLWKLDAKRFYLGSGDGFHSFYKTLYKILSKRKTSFLKPFRSVLVLFLYVSLAKHVYYTIERGRRYSKKGGIAIFDRFPQMQYEGINDGPKIEFLSRGKKLTGLRHLVVEYFAKQEKMWLSKAVLLEPDIIFKLLLSPEESFRRKPHEDFALIKEKHEVINNIKFNEAKTFVVDAEQNYVDEIREIKCIIWQEIQKL